MPVRVLAPLRLGAHEAACEVMTDISEVGPYWFFIDGT
jgi:hypothetical protein